MKISVVSTQISSAAASSFSREDSRTPTTFRHRRKTTSADGLDDDPRSLTEPWKEVVDVTRRAEGK